MTGPLTLDALGDRTAFWIFLARGTLTAAPDSLVRVINGGYDGNVFWQVDGSATLGARTTFVGSILARGDITLEAGASLSGRALSQTGTGSSTEIASRSAVRRSRSLRRLCRPESREQRTRRYLSRRPAVSLPTFSPSLPARFQPA